MARRPGEFVMRVPGSCFIWEKNYRKFIKAQQDLKRRSVNVWVVGKVSRRAARTWTPDTETGGE